MWRWKSWSNVETTSWFRRSVLQWVSCLRTDFHFQLCVGLQNQISVQARIKRILPEDSGLIVEWSWRNSRISDLWRRFLGKQGMVFGFTLNQTKNVIFIFYFFNFPRTGNWENFSFGQSQHVKLPPGNNFTAPSSCWVKSTFLVLSRFLIIHQGCQGSPLHSSASLLLPQQRQPSSPAHSSWSQTPNSHKRAQGFQAPDWGDWPCWAFRLSSLEEKDGEPWGIWLPQGLSFWEPWSTSAGSGALAHLTEHLFSVSVEKHFWFSEKALVPRSLTCTGRSY